MSKKYILTKEDLQNLIHETISFFSDKSRDSIKSGKQIMFSDRVKWIEEFLNKALIEIPVDTVLDDVDQLISSYGGSSLEEIKERLRKKEPTLEKETKAVKAYLKELE